MIGDTLSERYAITGLLGRGGMAVVYEARHTGTGRRVAVKVINAEFAQNADLIKRFQMEARATGEIESQYIAQVLDTGIDVGRNAPFIVMEYLTGEDMQSVLERLGPLPPDLALRMFAQACLGLEKAHAAKIIHRDIKPANMFLTERDGGERLVKLLDFGIAKRTESLASSNVTRAGGLVGTPFYMSPEQARGQKTIDHRTDIWSLGVSLYQALTGRTPFHDVDALGELIIAICASPPPPVRAIAPWISPEISALVDKALVIDVAGRFQTANEMYRALRALIHGGIAIDSSMVVPLGDAAREGAPPPTMRLAPGVTPEVAATAAFPAPGRGEVAAARSAPIEGDSQADLRSGGSSRPATPGGAAASSSPGLASSALTAAPVEVASLASSGRVSLSASQAAAAAPPRSKIPLLLGVTGLACLAIGFLVLRPHTSTTAQGGSPPPVVAPPPPAVVAPPPTLPEAPPPTAVAVTPAPLTVTPAETALAAPTASEAGAPAASAGGRPLHLGAAVRTAATAGVAARPVSTGSPGGHPTASPASADPFGGIRK